jgi:ATP-dependent protease ClpP protease subunit
MNIIHHEEIPVQLIENQVITYTKQSIFGDKIDIRMDSEIKGHETVRNIIKVLQEAKPSDKIIFHLAGYGGEVEVVEDIINNIKVSKAHVIMQVEAPVYSGHAYLALSGDELIMLPYSYLMLHTSSGYGSDCSKETGTDRTVSNVEHCEAGLKAHLDLINKVLNELPFLTSDEKARIMTGHDFYMTSDEYKRRLSLFKGSK